MFHTPVERVAAAVGGVCAGPVRRRTRRPAGRGPGPSGVRPRRPCAASRRRGTRRLRVGLGAAGGLFGGADADVRVEEGADLAAAALRDQAQHGLAYLRRRAARRPGGASAPRPRCVPPPTSASAAATRRSAGSEAASHSRVAQSAPSPARWSSAASSGKRAAGQYAASTSRACASPLRPSRRSRTSRSTVSDGLPARLVVQRLAPRLRPRSGSSAAPAKRAPRGVRPRAGAAGSRAWPVRRYDDGGVLLRPSRRNGHCRGGACAAWGRRALAGSGGSGGRRSLVAPGAVRGTRGGLGSGCRGLPGALFGRLPGCLSCGPVRGRVAPEVRPVVLVRRGALRAPASRGRPAASRRRSGRPGAPRPGRLGADCPPGGMVSAPCARPPTARRSNSSIRERSSAQRAVARSWSSRAQARSRR